MPVDILCKQATSVVLPCKAIDLNLSWIGLKKSPSRAHKVTGSLPVSRSRGGGLIRSTSPTGAVRPKTPTGAFDGWGLFNALYLLFECITICIALSRDQTTITLNFRSGWHGRLACVQTGNGVTQPKNTWSSRFFVCYIEKPKTNRFCLCTETQFLEARTSFKARLQSIQVVWRRTGEMLNLMSLVNKTEAEENHMTVITLLPSMMICLQPGRGLFHWTRRALHPHQSVFGFTHDQGSLVWRYNVRCIQWDLGILSHSIFVYWLFLFDENQTLSQICCHNGSILL